MKVEKLEEAGYFWALLGTSLSRNQPIDNMPNVCKTLATKEKGHNKFLEFMVVWLDITAPRFFWQQMATYRIGSSWLSESTMYTITKNKLEQINFEYPIDEIILQRLNDMIEKKDLGKIKNHLPEGFLQRRIMVTNYKALRNIITQRWFHKLPQWQFFNRELLDQIDHPEFIVENYEKGADKIKMT